MLRSTNVATPFTAVSGLRTGERAGMSMPPLCPMAIVTGGDWDQVAQVVDDPHSTWAA
jgi:hypothetical protein